MKTVILMSCCLLLSACGKVSVYLPPDCAISQLSTEDDGRQTVLCRDGRMFSASPGTQLRSRAD